MAPKSSTVLAVHNDHSTEYPSKAVLRNLQITNAELERQVQTMARELEELRKSARLTTWHMTLR